MISDTLWAEVDALSLEEKDELVERVRTRTAAARAEEESCPSDLSPEDQWLCRRGIHVIPPDGTVVTSDLINKLRDELGV
ncbi:MAG: hypothetical protein FWD59_10980 [Micrococcales bacterium]|nr:hypothetical protein [Micrococcales bacterium]